MKLRQFLPKGGIYRLWWWCVGGGFLPCSVLCSLQVRKLNIALHVVPGYCVDGWAAGLDPQRASEARVAVLGAAQRPRWTRALDGATDAHRCTRCRVLVDALAPRRARQPERLFRPRFLRMSDACAMPGSCAEALLLSVSAKDVDNDQALDTASRTRFPAPLPVPERGVFAWELQGLASEAVALPPTGLLGDDFTVALWCKLAPLRDRGAGGALLADEHFLFGLGPDRASVGLPGLDGDVWVPLPPDARAAEAWQLHVLVGDAGGTVLLSAYAGDCEPRLSVAVPFSLSGRRLTRVGGDADGSVGWVSSVHRWGRRLSRRELGAVWRRGCEAHGVAAAPAGPRARRPPDGVVRLAGRVVDAGSGDPVPGARVETPHGACAADEAGAFALELAVAGGAATSAQLCCSCRGFAPQVVPVDLEGAGQTEVTLPSVALAKCSQAVTVPAADGAELRDEATGTRFSVPPNAFVRADGAAFTGTVALTTAVIDPSDPASLAAMPGDFRARDVRGRAVRLRTFGAMYVGATDAATGAALELAADCAGVAVEWEARVNTDVCSRAGVFPSMWRFDAATGQWVQDEDMPLSAGDAELPPPGLSVAEARAREAQPQPNEPAPGRPAPGAKKGKKGRAPALSADAAAKEEAAEGGDATVERFLAFFASSGGTPRAPPPLRPPPSAPREGVLHPGPPPPPRPHGAFRDPDGPRTAAPGDRSAPPIWGRTR